MFLGIKTTQKPSRPLVASRLDVDPKATKAVAVVLPTPNPNPNPSPSPSPVLPVSLALRVKPSREDVPKKPEPTSGNRLDVKSDRKVGGSFPDPSLFKVLEAASTVAQALMTMRAKPTPDSTVTSSPEQEELVKYADKTLSTKSTVDYFLWNQFALMQCTKIIKNSYFDGGHGGGCNIAECLNAYHAIFKDLALDGKSFFTLSAEEKALFKDLEDLFRGIYNRWIQHPKLSHLSNNALEKAALVQFDEINQSLDKKKFDYFPIGYGATIKKNGDVASAGHAAGCLIEEVGEELIISFFNLGEGVQAHPELGFTTTHTLPSSAFYMIKISKQVWKEVGKVFTAHLIRLKVEILNEDDVPHSMIELYDLLSTLGRLDPSLNVERAPFLKGKAQHVGDCPEKCARNFIINYLLYKRKIPEGVVARIFLNIHFKSLVTGYQALLNPHAQNREHQELVRDGCTQASLYLMDARERGLLAPIEFERGVQLLNTMMKKTEGAPLLPPPKAKDPVAHVTTFSVSKAPEREPVVLTKYAPPSFQKVVLLPAFNPLVFKAELSKWVVNLDKLSKEEKTHSIYYSLNTFPIPRWQDANDPWNKIPLKDIQSILNDLKKVAEHFDIDDNLPVNYMLTRRYLIYSVADKLIRLSDVSRRLNGFACPFSAFWNEHFLAFEEPAEGIFYIQVKEYFMRASQETRGVTIDPRWIQTGVQDRISGRKTPAAHFIDVLDRFQPTNKIADYEQLYNSPHIPVEVHMLTFFVEYGNRGHCDWDRYVGVIYDVIKRSQTETSNELTIRNPAQVEDIYENQSFKRNFLEIATILKHPSLKVGLAIQWMRGHLKDLNERGFQEMIELAFLTPYALKDAIEARSETIDELRFLIATGLKFYKNQFENYVAILFLLRMGLILETHFASILGQKIDSRMVGEYRKTTNELLTKIGPAPKNQEEAQTRLNLMMFSGYLEVFREDQTETDWIDVFSSLFSEPMERSHSPRDEYYAFSHKSFFRIYKQLSLKWKKFLANKGDQGPLIFNRICHEILGRLLGAEAPILRGTFKWNDDGIVSSERCVLDFNTFRITHPNLYVPLKKALFELRKVPFPKIYWALAGSMTGQDYDLDLTETQCVWYRKKEQLLKRSTPHNAFASSEISLFAIENPDLYFLHKFDAVDIRETPFLTQKELWMTLKGTKDLHTCCVMRDNKMTVQRVDSHRNKKGAVLVNLKKLPETHPHYSKTLKFAPWNEVMCYVNERTNEIEELHFLKHNLSFKRNGQELESIEFPGFFWKDALTLDCLGALSKEAIILKNAENRIKVILPNPRKETRSLGISTNENERLLATLPFMTYVIFDLENVRGELKGKNFTEQLFLIYFYKVHSHFIKAEKLLKELRQPLEFTVETFSVLFLFIHIKNYSAESLSFNMKLLLFVVEKFSQLKTKTLKEYARGFLYYAKDWHVNYLRVLGSDTWGGIPKKDRLEEGDEAFILSIFLHELKDVPKILEIREELLKTKDRVNTEQYKAKDIDITPSMFAYVPPPKKLKVPQGLVLKAPKDFPEVISYPNRLCGKYIRENFWLLFEKARRASPGLDPFDFELLAILKVSWEIVPEDVTKDPIRAQESAKNKNEGLFLARVLFYVRHFSSHFKKIPVVGLLDNEERCMKVFGAIFKKIARLQKLGSYPDFVKEVMQKKVPFNYTPKITVKMPPKVGPMPLVSSPTPSKNTGLSPFAKVLPKLFKMTALSDGPTTPLFDRASYFPKPTPQEEELLMKFEAGQKMMSNSQAVRYVKKTDQIFDVVAEMNVEKNKIEECITKLTTSIHSILNQPYSTKDAWKAKMELEMLFNAEQVFEITPEMVMQKVILRNDAAFLRQERPMLSDSQIQAVIDDVHELYHQMVILSMYNEALPLVIQLGNDDVLVENALLDLLNYQFSYDPVKYPEIAFFRIKVGLLPRPHQIAIHIWVCDGMKSGKNRYYSAGGATGKTSYNTPLEILHAQRYHLMPIYFATQAMYPTDKANLATILNLLGIELETLEMGLDFEFNMHDLTHAHLKLKNILRKRSALILTPETFYALKLNYKGAVIPIEETQPVVTEAFAQALKTAPKSDVQDVISIDFLAMLQAENQSNTTSLLSDHELKARADLEQILLKTLNLFKNYGMAMVDESHRSVDPSTQSIIGTGEMSPLLQKEGLLIFELMKPLVGLKPDVALKVKFKWGRKAKDELTLMRRGFAEEIAKTLFKNPQDARPFLAFWTDKEAPPPSWPPNMTQEEKGLIKLVRNFLIDILPRILVMNTDDDHRASPEKGDIDIPAHFSDPSTAQYKDPVLAAAVSIKGTYHRGLSKPQVKALVTHLKKQESHEQVVTLNIDATPTHLAFKEWTNMTLREVNVDDKGVMETLESHLKHNKDAIHIFFFEGIFLNILYSSEELQVNPIDFIRGFNFSIVFSATPLPNASPNAASESRMDMVFESQVARTAQMPKNQNWIEIENSTQLFAKLNADKQKYAKVFVIVDAGGLFCRESNFEIAKSWINASTLDGVFYFDNTSKRLCLLLRKDWRIIEFRFGTSKITEELDLLKINRGSLRLGTYHGSAHAESVNIPPPPDCQGIMLINENLTLSHGFQAFLRLRGFLVENMKQTLILALPPELKKKITVAKRPFDIGAVLSMCLRNEAKRWKNCLQLAALQEIGFCVAQMAYHPANMQDTSKKRALIPRYSRAFKEKVDPRAGFEMMRGVDDAQKVLWAHAKATYDRFGFEAPFESQKALLKEVGDIIQSYSLRIPKMTTHVSQKATIDVHKKSLVKREVQQTIAPKRHLGRITAAKAGPTLDITSPQYPTLLLDENKAKHLFTTTSAPPFTDHFYIEDNQFHTAECDGVPLGHRLLKEIGFVLITVAQNRVFAVALSNETAEEYRKTLKTPQSKALAHVSFMIRADGVFYQAGTGTLAPTKAQLAQTLKSPWLKNVLVDVAILNGLLLLNDAFKEKISNWPAFNDFWLGIIKALPQRKGFSYQALDSYISFVKKSSNHLILNFK